MCMFEVGSGRLSSATASRIMVRALSYSEFRYLAFEVPLAILRTFATAIGAQMCPTKNENILSRHYNLGARCLPFQNDQAWYIAPR